MNYQGKTKEELIKMVQTTQDEYRNLKELYKKDITIRKQTDNLLQLTHNNYESFFNTIDDFLFVLDEQANMIHINTTVTNRLGYTKEELLGNSVLMIHPQDRREEAGCIVGKMLAGEAEYCPVPIVTKSGVQIPVETRVTKGLWDNRSAIYGVTKDISRIQLSEEKFSKIFYINPSACGFSDVTSHEYIEVNEAFYTLFGFDKNEVIGKTAHDLGILTHEAANVILQQADDKGHIKNVEANLKAKNGDIKHVLLSSENFYVQNKQYRFTCVNDITRIKQIKKELQKEKNIAEENDRLKSAFLANMSHEIRTPMNGILGFADLLKEDNLSGLEQQEYIQIIEKSGARMLNTINDIIDISKIESGQMKIFISHTNINEQIEDIYNFFKPEVESKGIQFFFKNTLPSERSIIQTDSEKVYAILTNIVKNAIKYSNEGSIEFGYYKKGEFLEFFVKDTGIGIPDKKQNSIFKRFIKADSYNQQGIQGTGLGLAISKAYVEKLGGRIWLNSQEGKGSVFYFTIPYNIKSTEKKITRDDDVVKSLETHVQKLNVLIAEDDETSEMLITEIVKMFSKEIISVKTGLETVETCQNNPDIDLILLDIQMPLLSGYEVARQIRKFNTDVVIIAQTAYGLNGDKEKAIEAGCNEYISKPINKNELQILIQKNFKG